MTKGGKTLALHGSLAALPTPFRGGEIDTEAFAGLCERHLARGTTGLVICGSTGEAPALRPEEQADLVALAVGIARRRAPVIAGCGAPCTESALVIARLAARVRADALLCAPTPYVKPSQDGIAAHVRTLAVASGLPVILYDVPGRTGVSVRDETIAALFEHGVIVGVKDATADLARPPRLRALCGDGLAQLSGDDATAAAYRAAGGHGCISVTANLTPALCAALHTAWDRGDLVRFADLRDRLAPLHDALFAESNPVPLKAGLELLDLCTADVRLPLTRASEATRWRLERLLGRLATREEAGIDALQS
ncbi:MAG TPA: 4-hydroxy-tetrahydrodipicolinate synthase [Rhodopila sp.]|uniref:4-hydroxy-tetrahydrodipicolinate synthase n=1 Tax=Rhodopila sp. TaxID=2480087 RepID=UPI002BEE036B|nr:4-hydroxy-tetrahydrodipicolinate synthase [Rhodopila sp.]HVY17241.1 4-hydroxy-tetrahydrodipicolinate synthase [Rhodopila sp.]